VLLTAIPGVNGLSNQVGSDFLRLNMMIPPSSSDPNAVNHLGATGGQLDGFPNGRRLAEDIRAADRPSDRYRGARCRSHPYRPLVDVQLRAVACGYSDFLAGALGLCNL
jgi:hypothetical protein